MAEAALITRQETRAIRSEISEIANELVILKALINAPEFDPVFNKLLDKLVTLRNTL